MRTPRPLVLAAAVAAVAALVAAAPAPPPDELTGLALGPDRLPDCAAVVAEMAPRARLAQRLVVGVQAEDPAAVRETVRLTQIGGIFVGGNGTPLLTDQALRGVQALSRVPLTVAVDDEGGRVQRVEMLDGELPSAREMSATMEPLQVREAGRDRARKLVARGVTTNFAPTVDVSDQPDGEVIGDRSFGDDPVRVAQYAGAFAEGQREAGLAVVLKHFPGHGRAAGDSHAGRVATPPLDALRGADLRPYEDLLGPGGALVAADTGVMVGHLDVPGLTEGLPTSLTPAVYALLRGEYGFDGVVYTDDLGAMKAITDGFALPEAVERALTAGADVALWSDGGRVTPVLDRLEEALGAGRLGASANDLAVARVLAAKGTCARR